MLEKVSQVAEQAATNVSRRAFLGRFGRGAAVAAAACAGLVVHASPARAGKRTRVCSTDSAQQVCQGQPYGSPCTTSTGEEGRCFSDQKQISRGVYDCNVCKGKDGRGRGRCPAGTRDC